jgi:hypothetical protein
MLTYISAILGKMDLLRRYYDPIKDSKVDKKFTLYFDTVLQEGNFALAQKLCMNKFKTQPDPKLFLGSIYLQYYNFMKDMNPKFLDSSDKNKLKMVKMFLPKIEGMFDSKSQDSLDTLKKFDLDLRVYHDQVLKLKGDVLFRMELYDELFAFIQNEKVNFRFDEYLDWVYQIFSGYLEKPIEDSEKSPLDQAVKVYVGYVDAMSSLAKFRANYETIHKFLLKFFEIMGTGKLPQNLEFFRAQFESGDAVKYFLEQNSKPTEDPALTLVNLLRVF